ncbi:MAG: hypothetical protein K2N93_00265 [Alistipes sp.]|nr:hypothetical protein [Alistipes sp.]
MKLKTILLQAVLLFGAALPCAAQNDAAAWLTRLRDAIARRGSYAVHFSVATSEEFAGKGYYLVDGEAYYLVLGDAEVFCDGRIRYEVSRVAREVTVVSVDGASRNLLDNPTHAFDFLGENYASELLSADADKAVVRLVPRSKGAISEVLLTIDARSGLPQYVTYGADGLGVEVSILSFERLQTPVLTFDPARYADYELIDFR